MLMKRRGFLAGLLAAPVLIPSTNLMKLSWRSSPIIWRESVADPVSLFGLDVEEELAALLAVEIQREMDVELMRKLRAQFS
jgi:hypothetical protein